MAWSSCGYDIAGLVGGQDEVQEEEAQVPNQDEDADEGLREFLNERHCDESLVEQATQRLQMVVTDYVCGGLQ